MPRNDDQLTEVFERVYERVDASASEAPEWSTIAKPTVGSAVGRKGPLTALVAAAAVFILVGGVAMVYAPWLRSDTSPASGPIEGVVVAVYLADDIDAYQLQRVTDTLTTQSAVIDWRYVSKTEAYEEARVRWADDERTSRVLEENPDLLPASIRLLTANQSDAVAIRAFAFEMFPTPTAGVVAGASASGTLANTRFPISLPVPPIDGFWVLESFSIDGVDTGVDVGVNAVTRPWIELGTALAGNTGCGSFHGTPDGHSFTDGVLTPGEIVLRAAGCDSATENAFVAMLRDYPEGIEIEVLHGDMVWTAGDTQLVFTSSEAPIPPAAGPFEAIPFTGDGWQLKVTEGANPSLGTYKVCYTFLGPGKETEASGIGPSGCSDWPADVDSHLIEVVAAVETTSGVVLFIDLTDNPVHAVIVTTDSGESSKVEPFRMPDSGKQFAVIELPNRDGGAVVELVDESGAVLDQVTVDSLEPGN